MNLLFGIVEECWELVQFAECFVPNEREDVRRVLCHSEWKG
jgi:hypothetical protein